MEDGAQGTARWLSPAWEEKKRIAAEWRSPELEELMPDLSRDEQLRLQRGLQERELIRKKTRKFPRNKKFLPSSYYPLRSITHSDSTIYERKRDSALVPTVLDGLRHYNARHPGGEFDLVKPLMRCHVRFLGQLWFHMNFWARSRTNSKMIKRFFAEIHYKMSATHPKGCQDPQKPIDVIPIVEICTIIEEPLCQYKLSCGFCAANLDIMHPKGCRKFVCGNDKDRFGQRLELCNQSLEMPFAHFFQKGST